MSVRVRLGAPGFWRVYLYVWVSYELGASLLDPVSLSPDVTTRAKLVPAAFSASSWECKYTAIVNADSRDDDEGGTGWDESSI